MEFLQNIPLKVFNTFGIEVDAQWFVRVASAEELKEAIAFAQEHKLQVFILGGGSNVLFTADFNGLIIHMKFSGIKIEEQTAEHVIIKAGAGVIWDDLVAWTVNHNFGGLENLSLIPGSVGAGPVQNIGAYGVELKDNFHSLEFIHFETGQIQEFNREQCKFDYRNSIFKQELKGKGAVISVSFKLDKNPEINTSYGTIQDELNKSGTIIPGIAQVRNAVIEIRKSKLPDPAVIGNAGSFFKNPVIEKSQFENLIRQYPKIVAFHQDDERVKLAAGWLIDQCGWRGYRKGDAGVHDKQALVLVNFGKAKGKDILELSEKIQVSIYDRFGVTLEREVNVL